MIKKFIVLCLLACLLGCAQRQSPSKEAPIATLNTVVPTPKNTPIFKISSPTPTLPSSPPSTEETKKEAPKQQRITLDDIRSNPIDDYFYYGIIQRDFEDDINEQGEYSILFNSLVVQHTKGYYIESQRVTLMDGRKRCTTSQIIMM